METNELSLQRTQCGSYLARRLAGLTDSQLDRLTVDQQAILRNPPAFDPSRLDRAHREADRVRRAWATTSGPERADIAHGHAAWREHIAALEHDATAHARWRTAAENAIERLGAIRATQQVRMRVRT